LSTWVGEAGLEEAIVAFSVAEGWARFVTADVARKVIDQPMTTGQPVPGETRRCLRNLRA
jgi:hypothetical protein